jgi:hypothetical protein
VVLMTGKAYFGIGMYEPLERTCLLGHNGIYLRPFLTLRETQPVLIYAATSRPLHNRQSKGPVCEAIRGKGNKRPSEVREAIEANDTIHDLPRVGVDWQGCIEIDTQKPLSAKHCDNPNLAKFWSRPLRTEHCVWFERCHCRSPIHCVHVYLMIIE